MTAFFKTRPHKTSTTQLTHKRWGAFQFHRSNRVRRLRLSVEPWLGILIKGPLHAQERHAHQLLNSLGDWLQDALDHNQKLESKASAFYSQAEKLDRKSLKNMLGQRLDRLARTHGFEYSKVTLRDQKTRWGSCSAQNAISLNQKLQFLPSYLIDYVLIHELAHTRHKNHGPQFWSTVYHILGEGTTQRCRSELKDYTFLFYPPPQAV